MSAESCLWKKSALLGCAGEGHGMGTEELCCGKPGVIIQMSEQGLEHYSQYERQCSERTDCVISASGTEYMPAS